MLDPAASRRITANLAVVYPSLPCGRVEPSIVPVRQVWQIQSAVSLLECDQISRFRLRWSCLGASIEAFGTLSKRDHRSNGENAVGPQIRHFRCDDVQAAAYCLAQPPPSTTAGMTDTPYDLALGTPRRVRGRLSAHEAA